MYFEWFLICWFYLKIKLFFFTLLLINRSSSFLWFFQETICPPYRSTWNHIFQTVINCLSEITTSIWDQYCQTMADLFWNYIDLVPIVLNTILHFTQMTRIVALPKQESVLKKSKILALTASDDHRSLVSPDFQQYLKHLQKVLPI